MAAPLRPWRVTFTWAHPSNDPDGPAIRAVQTYPDREDAAAFVDRMHRRARRTGTPLETVLGHRDADRAEDVYRRTPEAATLPLVAPTHLDLALTLGMTATLWTTLTVGILRDGDVSELGIEYVRELQRRGLVTPRHHRPARPLVTAAGRKLVDTVSAMRAVVLGEFDATEEDYWRCPCGNDPSGEGLHPARMDGTADVDAPEWSQHQTIVCCRCGRYGSQLERSTVTDGRAVVAVAGQRIDLPVALAAL